MTPVRVLIMTGLSGSGKSTAARALEDQGFFVVDNLPLPLFSELLELVSKQEFRHKGVVLVTDARNFDFPSGYEKTFGELRAQGYSPEIYFLDASDEFLIRRFSETRRRHPLEAQSGIPGAILRERQLLIPLRAEATRVFDTTGLSPHQLKHLVQEAVLGKQSLQTMSVRIQSFGFRYGVPQESDTLFDVRFLPNPHFDPLLGSKSGLTAEVAQYVLDNELASTFLDQVKRFLEFLLPLYRKEGKANFTLSIGCTGGRHRSVAIVEALRKSLAGLEIPLEFYHRDVTKAEK